MRGTGIVGPGHPDYAIIHQVEAEILKRAGGIDRLRAEFPQLIRRGIDEVIDMPRTRRLRLDQCEKTEKTYLGTKIEILLREFLGLPKGILDLVVDGLDVDIKNTVGTNWMIPGEAIGKPCILIMSDEKLALCQLGIVVAHQAYLRAGNNRDKKGSFSASSFQHIYWILINYPYPPNFWENFDVKTAQWIMLGRSGSERLSRLFKSALGVSVHRDIIQGVAQQKDYMKRLRKNGGARDTLARERIALLSGAYDAGAIARLGLDRIGPDEFIAFKAELADDIAYLKGTGHIE